MEKEKSYPTFEEMARYHDNVIAVQRRNLIFGVEKIKVPFYIPVFSEWDKSVTSCLIVRVMEFGMLHIVRGLSVRKEGEPYSQLAGEYWSHRYAMRGLSSKYLGRSERIEDQGALETIARIGCPYFHRYEFTDKLTLKELALILGPNFYKKKNWSDKLSSYVFIGGKFVLRSSEIKRGGDGYSLSGFSTVPFKLL